MKILIAGIRGMDPHPSRHIMKPLLRRNRYRLLSVAIPRRIEESLNRFSELMQLISGDFVSINLFNDPTPSLNPLSSLHPFRPYLRI